MRIGTWNMDGRTGPQHAELLTEQDCDVWLLTEVPERLDVPGYVLHLGETVLGPRKRWAGILSRRTTAPIADPHPASAAAQIAGRTCVSSVLPWNGCGEQWPWDGSAPAAKTAEALRVLTMGLSGQTLVWGGDWNHGLGGTEAFGTLAGRESLRTALDAMDLQVPTSGLPHRLSGLETIDHIAVPRSGVVVSAHRISTIVDGRALSDHDAYVVEIA